MHGSTSTTVHRKSSQRPVSLGDLGALDVQPSFVYPKVTYQPIQGAMTPTYPLWCAKYTAEDAIQQAVADHIHASFGLVAAESKLRSAADLYMASTKRMSELSIHLEWTGQREDQERFTHVFRNLKRMSLEEKRLLLAGLMDAGF